MANRNPTPPAQRPPFAWGAGALLVGALVVAVIFINKANGLPSTASGAGSAATGTAGPTPSPTPANIPYANCSAVTFGPNLQPLGEPPDPHTYTAPPAMQIDTTKLYRVTITTARGPIVLCLQPDLAPTTVNNFVVLARNHFYDGLKFHRVVAGFVVQGGDPQGTGAGGPGYTIAEEPVRQQYVLGALAMAKSQAAHTTGSQFFICIADDTAQLQPLYSLFGRVASGIDVAQKTVQGDVMQTVTVAPQQ